MAYSPRLRFKLGLLIIAGWLLSGCATTSIFNPYPQQAAGYRAAITQGTIDSVTPQLAQKSQGQDRLLYLSESGRLHQLNNQFEASKADFEAVIAGYEGEDDRARLSLSSLAAGASSLVSNDNAIPYAGYGFERIFVHHYQALNYLGLGDIEGASVELRRAALEQRVLEQEHDKEINAAEEKAESNNLDLSVLKDSPELAGMSEVAGRVKSSFQNAYTFYTSAVIWEAMGDLNAALVDYKKALEINPYNSQIKADIKRVDRGAKPSSKTGALVVLFEDGFVPERSSAVISFPDVHHGTYHNIAFPFYSMHLWYQPQTLTLYDNGRSLGRTQQISDVAAMAVKSLQEKIPSLLVRQLLRARAKYELHQKASQDGNVLGSFVATLYNMASEQADLRNWLTLPNNAQILRAQLTPGQHRIELDLGGVSRTVDVTIRPAGITLLRVVNAGNRLLTQSFTL